MGPMKGVLLPMVCNISISCVGIIKIDFGHCVGQSLVLFVLQLGVVLVLFIAILVTRFEDSFSTLNATNLPNLFLALRKWSHIVFGLPIVNSSI